MFEVWFARTLVIAPHCDDESIGCGGLVARLADAGWPPTICTATGSMLRLQEFEHAVNTLGARHTSHLRAHDFGENELDRVPMRTLVGLFDEALSELRLTAVLLPYPSHHQDHQKVYHAAIAALRPRPRASVLFAAMYEYPFVDAWHHQNIKGGKLTVDISDHLETKLQALRCHKSQMACPNTSLIHPDNVKRWAEMRGAEIGVAAGEAYYPLRQVIPCSC